MSGLADINTYLGSAGYDAVGSFPEVKTVGGTWRWQFADFADASGAPIDFTHCTCTCEILTAIGGSVIATPTFVGAVGGFTLSVPASTTAGLTPQRGVWFCQITDAGGEDVPFWGVTQSPFNILAKD